MRLAAVVEPDIDCPRGCRVHLAAGVDRHERQLEGIHNIWPGRTLRQLRTVHMGCDNDVGFLFVALEGGDV